MTIRQASHGVIPMRIGFLSDIHGNAIALKSCWKRLAQLRPEAVYFLGDAIGYFPAAREVLEFLTHAGVICQQGNHERMLFAPAGVPPEREAVYRLNDARAQLSETHLQTLASWPTVRELTVGGNTLLLVHGSPSTPLDGYVYPDTDLRPWHGVVHDVVVMGHTHRPFVRLSGAKLFVNTGSIGLPRDHGNLSAFAIFDSDLGAFEIIRVPFDVDETLLAYGSQIADSTRACLRRSPKTGRNF
jgi:putative phosphoesterase